MSKIDEQAAKWVVRLAEANPEQREIVNAALEQWLAHDVRHRGAFVRAQGVWHGLDRYASLAGRGGHPGDRLEPRISRRLMLLGGTAVALAATGGGFLFFDGRSAANSMYRSNLGEVRELRLADGSQLVLNTESSVAVHFGRKERDIRLLQGEALFRVAKHRNPFVVYTADVVVRAVGTVFSIRRYATHVAVLVTEGVVEVQSAKEGTWRVAANQAADVNSEGLIETRSVQEVDAVRRLAWRSGMVSFAGEPLSVAVEEINRHNRRRIIVDDAELGTKPIVGSFRASDTQTFALVVAAALDATVEDGAETVHLRSH
jgi:transmembrane sensor